MKLIEIARRSVTVELTPEDCQRLAVLCDDFAHGNDNRGLLIAMASMYATAFEAASMASVYHSHVTPDSEISLAMLRDHKVLDQGWDGSRVQQIAD